MSLGKLASNVAAGVTYPGHRHFAQRLINRRGFLEKSGITLGALAASGILPELARAVVPQNSRPQQHDGCHTASHSRRPAITRSDGSTVPCVPPGSWCRAFHDHELQRLRGLGRSRWHGHPHRQRPGARTPSLRGRRAFHARRVRWALMGGITTVPSASYDLMYTQVPWRTCKFTISILGSRKVDCFGRSQSPKTQFRLISPPAPQHSRPATLTLRTITTWSTRSWMVLK